ncbi:DUF899 family protein [Streptomyces sp. NPDC000941]
MPARERVPTDRHRSPNTPAHCLPPGRTDFRQAQPGPQAADVFQNRPPVVSRREWLAVIGTLRAREKAHTREGDAIAAARRRLPMTEVDPSTPLVGSDGDIPLIDVFEGRTQLFVSYHMWHDGRSAADQCEGCTFFTGQVRELSYLHQRDVSFAVWASVGVLRATGLSRRHLLSSEGSCTHRSDCNTCGASGRAVPLGCEAWRAAGQRHHALGT